MTTPKSILLVEDDLDDQEFFKEAIAGIGNITLLGIAGNGTEALNTLAFATALPDIVFMDVNMPGMNGIECLARFKTNTRFKNVSVVMLSSAVWEMEMVRLLGAKAFIRKTGNQAVFREQLQQVFDTDFVVNNHGTKETFQMRSGQNF